MSAEYEEILLSNLRYPLKKILLQSQNLLSEAQTWSNQRKLQQLHCETEDLLHFLEKSRDQTKIFFVEEALQECIEILNHLYPEALICFQRTRSKQSLLQGQKSFFRQICLCLLQQALLAYRKEDKQYLLLTLSPEKNFLKFTITHGGRNFPRWQQRFFQVTDILRENSAKKSFSKIQLAQRLIEKHFSGRLTLLSQGKRGSTFCCYFPQKFLGDTQDP